MIFIKFNSGPYFLPKTIEINNFFTPPSIMTNLTNEKKDMSNLMMDQTESNEDYNPHHDKRYKIINII